MHFHPVKIFLVAFFTIISINAQKETGKLVLSNRAEFLTYFATDVHWDVVDAGPGGGMPVQPGAEYFYLTRFGGQEGDEGGEVEEFSFIFHINEQICDLVSLRMSIRYCNFDTKTIIWPTPIYGRRNSDDFHMLKSHNFFEWDEEEFLLDHTAGIVSHNFFDSQGRS